MVVSYVKIIYHLLFKMTLHDKLIVFYELPGRMADALEARKDKFVIYRFVS